MTVTVEHPVAPGPDAPAPDDILLASDEGGETGGRRWVTWGRWMALVVALGVGAFTHLHRLGGTTALLDELTYAQSGLDAVQGTYSTNASPYLARLAFGAAQVVLGEGVVAARLVSATASILTGVVLFVFARRLAGWWAGVAALVAWSVLPQATRAPDGSLTMVKLGRSALLEPPMVLFVVLAVYLTWRWLEEGRSRHAVLAGMAVGAAVASKPTAALLLPVMVVAALLVLGRTWRAAGQVVGLAVCALVVVAASYLPLGAQGPGAAQELVEYQLGEHADSGHPVIVAGEVFDRAPWWAYAWWQWQSLGTAATVAVAVAALAAVAWSPRRRAVLLVAATVAVPALYLSFAGAFGLSHYLHLWQPLLVLLATLGVVALVRRGWLARTLGVGLAATLVVVGADTVATVATLEPRGYGRLGQVLAARDVEESAVVVWGQTLVTQEYLPGAQLVLAPDEASDPILAVVVDPGTVRRDPRPAVDAWLEAHESELDVVRVDHLTVHVRRPATVTAAPAPRAATPRR